MKVLYTHQVLLCVLKEANKDHILNSYSTDFEPNTLNIVFSCLLRNIQFPCFK